MRAPITAVPELGPLLGRFASPLPRGPAALPLDDLRRAALGGLYARAGLARRELSAGRPDVARDQLSRDAWLALWGDATGQVADRVMAEIERRLAMAAAESRMGPRRLAPLRPSDEDRQSLKARIEAAGIPLENVIPPEAVDSWGDGLFRAAMAIDESWERLEQVVIGELAAWQGTVEQVRAWRRPLAPLWVVTVLGLAAALALGLTLGGYLPARGPLGMMQRWFWSLPWP